MTMLRSMMNPTRGDALCVLLFDAFFPLSRRRSLLRRSELSLLHAGRHTTLSKSLQESNCLARGKTTFRPLFFLHSRLWMCVEALHWDAFASLMPVLSPFNCVCLRSSSMDFFFALRLRSTSASFMKSSFVVFRLWLLLCVCLLGPFEGRKTKLHTLSTGEG
jgi:hypothetical protein